MKEQIPVDPEQLKLFEMTQLLDPNTGETIAWIIFPRNSEEFSNDANT
jgi:hypothetical protein